MKKDEFVVSCGGIQPEPLEPPVEADGLPQKYSDSPECKEDQDFTVNCGVIKPLPVADREK